MAKAKATVIITEGAPGSGKSFCRCAGFIPEFLHQVRPTEEAPCLHISNFPVMLDDRVDEDGKVIKGLVTYCWEKYQIPEVETRERVVVLSDETIEEWKRFKTGPWDYFEDANLAGCHIALDEAHELAPKMASGPKHRTKWADWLALIRHRGCSVELLTQDEKSIAPEVLHKVGMKISLFNTENTRDPFFRILLGDWFELVCGFTPWKIPAIVHESERVKQEGAWRVQNRRAWALTPELFGLYDSYNKPSGSKRSGRTVDNAHKRFGKLGLLWWFWTRNWWPLSTRLSAAIFLVCFLFLGGPRWISAKYFAVWDEIGEAVLAKRAEKTGQPVKKPAPIAGKGATPGRDYLAELPAEVQAAVTPELRKELEMLYAALDRERAGREAAQLELDQVAGQLEALEDRVRRAFEVTAVGRDWVTFREGYTYGIGERIDWGPHEGDAIAAIDWNQRVCVLESGKRLRMAQPDRLVPRTIGDGVQAASDLVATQPAAERADVSGSLRTPGGGRAEQAGDGRRPAARDDLRAVDAARPVLPVAEQRSGRVDRGGTAARQPDVDDRRSRSISIRNPERGGAPPRGGSDQAGPAVLRGPAQARGSGRVSSPGAPADARRPDAMPDGPALR